MSEQEARLKRAADLIWAFRSGEYPADKLAKEMSIPRHEAVWLLKALETSGHGRFVIGRRDHPSRFVRGNTRPVEEVTFSAVYDEGIETADVGAQTLMLMRKNPVKISVPADLTRAEADKIARWLDVIVHD